GAMSTPRVLQHRAARRTLLRAAAGSALLAAAVAPLPTAARSRAGGAPLAQRPADTLVAQLDETIQAAMAQYHIPGVAVGVLYQGQEYVRGYCVTNVDYPQPVDEDTLFRIGSITKTFTGTTVMRLVEQGRLDLNSPVRTYLPGLRLSDESVAARVT